MPGFRFGTHRQKEKLAGSHDPGAYQLRRKRFAGGGTYPSVGTTAHITFEMVKMQTIGFADTTAPFVNFKNEPPCFIDKVLTLLREAGLRN